MREILFRGKRKDGGIWLCGDLRQWSDTRKGILDYSLRGTSEVAHETIGQFTGLSDKNGTKIFEGDIVDVDIGYLKRRGVVFYEESATRFGLEMKGGEEKNFSFLGRQMVKMYNVTVIGNIHDNPELLEVGA